MSRSSITLPTYIYSIPNYQTENCTTTLNSHTGSILLQMQLHLFAVDPFSLHSYLSPRISYLHLKHKMICTKYFYNAKEENKQQYRQEKNNFTNFSNILLTIFFSLYLNVAASVSLVVVPFLTKTLITLNYREYASVPPWRYNTKQE